MGIEQAFNDQTLLDVVPLLSARNESGRLKFAGGTMRGAFFFSKGKLVDAHLGPFSGFQAVNLAISVGKARLSFDPSIKSHSSSFNVPAERLILKERFGIETAAPETTKPDVPGSVEKVQTTSAPQTRPQPLPQQFETKAAIPVLTEIKSAPQTRPQPLPQQFETKAATPVLTEIKSTPQTRPQPLPQQFETKPSISVLTEIKKIAYGSREKFSLRGEKFSLRGVVNNWSSRRDRVLLMWVICLIVIPTTVGLASYWGNSPESTVRDLSDPKTSEASSAPVEPASSQPEETLTKAQPTDKPIPAKAQPSLVTAEISTQEPETNRLNPAPVKDSEVAKVTLDPPAVPAEPSARSLSRNIAVVVEIEEGRVTEAFIQQPKRELAAYEATALRLARQRRFPKGTTGRETVTLHVTREQ